MPAAANARAVAKKPTARASKKSAAATAPPRLSRQRKPESLEVEQWQRQLRHQFGAEQNFEWENIGHEPVFSEFRVHNPASGGRYRVAIRGTSSGDNFCSCGDFATNDLGTCKHIAFMIARLAIKRGGRAALARGFEPAYSEIYLHYGAVRSVRFRAGTDCPPALLAQARALFDAGAPWTLPWARLDDLAPFLASAPRETHELRCYDDALAFVARVRDAEQRTRLLAAEYPKGAASKGLAKLVKTTLYPYQAEGALFAARAGRVLIGDEMGLGKTIQAIAAAELMAKHFGVQRVLVICPTSLKHQWQREIARFSGREAQVLQGLRAARQQQYRDEGFCKITNYETLARDADLIAQWSPELLIVDEAQRIKNWNTIAARAIKRIASPYAIVLTGTPLENRLEELISIVQFVDQHRLGPTWRLRDEHQLTDDHGRVIGYRGLDRIGATLAPVMLRRRKAEVLEQLPARVDNQIFVALTPQQRMHHDENGDIVARIVQRWRRFGFLSDSDQRRLTCALQNMRMSCNSTFLLDHETDFGAKADELATLLDEWFEQPDAKVVVFSQWVRTHELIARRLNARGWGHVLFHGGVPGEQLGALVDRFVNDPECRVFLSTDAGGVGLNLQHAAAIVVNMDLPWNPAVLEQRIGRVYRLGQSRSVQVVNFVAQGSIEEGMLSVLAFKKSLFAGVLDGGESEIFLNGTRLSKFMDSVDEVTGAMGRPEAATDEPVADAELKHLQHADKLAAEPAMVITTDPIPQLALDKLPASPASPALLALLDAAPAAAETAASGPAAASAPDPWVPLIDVGLKLIESLVGAPQGAPPAWVETDAASGRSFVRLPVPEPAMLRQLGEVLAGLGAALRKSPRA